MISEPTSRVVEGGLTNPVTPGHILSMAYSPPHRDLRGTTTLLCLACGLLTFFPSFPRRGAPMKRLVQKGFTLIELMIVVAIIGILAAIAIPNFIKFQARSKQSEAKANLKASFTAMKAYYQEKDKYSSIVTEIGFVPERNNRFAYFLNGAAVVLSSRS